MPFTEDGYEPLTEEEIYNSLRNRFEDKFSVDVSSGRLVDEILQTEASVLSDFQEELASRVYDSAFVELAEGKQLTMKSRELGVVRQSPVSATGVAVFSRQNPTIKDYVIPEETTIQTDENEPIEFKTKSSGSIKYIDGFENGLSAEYIGDTASASVVSLHQLSGDGELKIDPTSGVSIHRAGDKIAQGTEFVSNVYHEVDTVSKTRFGVQDVDNCYQVKVDQLNNTINLEKVVAGTSTSLDNISVSIPSAEYISITVNWKFSGDIECTVRDKSDNVLGTVSTLNEQEFTDGYIGFGSGDSNGAKYWDEVACVSTAIDIEAVEAGSQTNVSNNSITRIKSTIAGVESVRNPNPTGNSDYNLTTGVHQVKGLNEETDDDLRNRVFNSLSGGGQATRGAIYTSVSNIDDVISLSIFTNPTPNDNTGTGGLPPYSSEVVVFGGNVDEIVPKLYSTMSFVDFLRLNGGAYGVQESYDVYDDTMKDSFTGVISRPSKVSLDISLDIIYNNDEYVGLKAVEEAIVDYIGGQSASGEPVIGLGVGDNVYKSEIRTAVSSVPGVLGISNLVLDENGDGTDDTVTDANGLDIIDVADQNVAQVNVYEGSVTINEIKNN